MNKYKLFFLIFGVSVILDQWTKYWVFNNIEYRSGEIKIIDGFFSLVHTHNSGAAFGIMEGQMLIFGIITIIAIVFIGYTLRDMDEDDRYQNVCLSLIGGGAIGNAIDRFLGGGFCTADSGFVLDFLRIYTEHETLKPWLIKNFHIAESPSFNVADSAIVVGLILFVFHGIFLEKDEQENEAENIKSPEPLEDKSEKLDSGKKVQSSPGKSKNLEFDEPSEDDIIIND